MALIKDQAALLAPPLQASGQGTGQDGAHHRKRQPAARPFAGPRASRTRPSISVTLHWCRRASACVVRLRSPFQACKATADGANVWLFRSRLGDAKPAPRSSLGLQLAARGTPNSSAYGEKHTCGRLRQSAALPSQFPAAAARATATSDANTLRLRVSASHFHGLSFSFGRSPLLQPDHPTSSMRFLTVTGASLRDLA